METALHNVAVVARHNWHLRLGVRWCPAALDSDRGYWSMKSLRNLVTNRSFIFTVVLYIGSLFALSRRPEFSISEALIELAIFGIAFPLLSWLATIRARPLTIRVYPTGAEMLALTAYILALSVYLGFGPQAIDSWLPQDWIASDRIKFFVTLCKKLLVFVALPLVIFGLAWRYPFTDRPRWQLRCSGFQLLFRWRGSSFARRQIFWQSIANRSATLFHLADDRSGTRRGILFSRFPSDTPERLVPIRNHWRGFNGAHLRTCSCTRLYLPACRSSRRARRKSHCARCCGLFHYNSCDKRCFFWRDLGQNEKSFCTDAHTRRIRSLSESFRFRQDLGFVEPPGSAAPGYRTLDRVVF